MQTVLIELRGELAAIQGNRRTVLLTGTNADLDKADARISSGLFGAAPVPRVAGPKTT